MRILHLRFKNLNSLAGEWEIDLSHQAFDADGLFAITGPTGAGKSTILDALCLALYGRTPRLAVISKSVNEIMSRLSGECFAEATFATRAGRFRCHWSQRRARKRPDGELQHPKHEIADAESGAVLESKIKGVAARVEAVTGMDFDRFTRSMLLAQGGFAAFLEADPDSRAPLLEQITGTEIYSVISRKVHELRTEHRTRRDLLEAELNGMTLLAPEEEQALQSRLEDISAEEQRLVVLVESTTQAIQWRRGLEQTRVELAALIAHQEQSEDRHAAFSPQRARLAAGERAANLSGHHAYVTLLRTEQAKDTEQRAVYQAALTTCQSAFEAARTAEQFARRTAEEAAITQQTCTPGLRAAREMDVLLAEKDRACQAALDAGQAHTKAVNALNRNEATAESTLAISRKTLTTLHARLEATAADEFLLTHITGIREQVAVLADIEQQLQARYTEEQATVARMSVCETTLNDALRRRDIVRTSHAQLDARIVRLEDELDLLLGPRTKQEWRAAHEALLSQRMDLYKTYEARRAIDEDGKTLAALEMRERELGQRVADLARRLDDCDARHKFWADTLPALERQFSEARQVLGYEEARRLLHDGKPCPLCGSEHHPYAKGQTTLPHLDQERLANARKEYQLIQQQQHALQLEKARLDKDGEQLIRDKERTTALLREASTRVEQCAARLAASLADVGAYGFAPQNPIALSEGSAQDIQRLTETNERQVAQAKNMLDSIGRKEQEISDIRRARETSAQALVRAERDASEAERAAATGRDVLERARQELGALGQRRTEALSRLAAALHPLGFELERLPALPSLMQTLDTRHARRLGLHNELARLEQDISRQELAVAHAREQLLQAEHELRKRISVHTTAAEELANLRKARLEACPASDPAAEESRLTEAVRMTSAALQAAQRAAQSAALELEKHRSVLSSLEKALRDRAGHILDAETTLSQRIQQACFADEQSFCAAVLSEEERRLLSEQAAALDNQRVAVASQIHARREQLALEEQKQLSGCSLEELVSESLTLQQAQKDVQQLQGAVRQKLFENRQLLQSRERQVAALTAQKRECARWDALHALIGSADGKKYRNFAQGLTFELMVRHANRQLAELTDRYMLVRDPGRPLDLNVMDAYQAGAIRSTRNLSGGETFIVSLALALGFSRMAGENVRVDSLFLDEGFGTLDEDALGTALEMLSGLRNKGKLIGVISHVTALRERISTQIRVKPRSGGRSILTGPGCRAVTEDKDGEVAQPLRKSHAVSQ